MHWYHIIWPLIIKALWLNYERGLFNEVTIQSLEGYNTTAIYANNPCTYACVIVLPAFLGSWASLLSALVLLLRGFMSLLLGGLPRFFFRGCWAFWVAWEAWLALISSILMNSSCVSFIIEFNGCIASVGCAEVGRLTVSAFTGVDWEAWDAVRGELRAYKYS